MKHPAIFALILLLIAAPLTKAEPVPDRGLNDHEHETHVEVHHEEEHEEAHEEEPAEEPEDEESVEEHHPNISFDDNSEVEHMRNFQAVSSDLKAYENEYMDCLRDIDDADFSENRVDMCIGHNFIKVLVDIKYVSMKTMSQGDSKVRKLFVNLCYRQALEDEEFSAGCDVMERDVLNMLWTGLNFVEILNINSDKYQYEYGKVPLNTWGQLIHELSKFSEEFFELIDEIDAHKEVTVLRLKNYIDDRIKLIAEMAGETEEIVGEAEPEPNHTIEVQEETVLDAERRRKLLPAFQIGQGNHKTIEQNRFLNAQAVRDSRPKKLYDKPQTPGVYMFSRMGVQKQNQATFGGPKPRIDLQQGRQAFRNIDLGKFKAK